MGCSPWGREESDTTERLHVHTLEKEMAPYSSVLAWRTPGTGSLVGCHSSGSSSSKGTLHAKMGSIKDRNGVDLTEAAAELRRVGYKYNWEKRSYKSKSGNHGDELPQEKLSRKEIRRWSSDRKEKI